MATRPTPLIDEEPTGQGKDHTHTDRLSYRGMGEVMPVDEGAPAEIAEGELTASRRVEFHIVRQLHPLEPQCAPASRLA